MNGTQPPEKRRGEADRRGAATADTALATAIGHHRAGRLEEAAAIYRQLLDARPDHFDSLNLLGVVMHQTGKNEAAVDLIGKAVALKPEFAEAHSNLGNALRGLGRLDEATAAHRKAIALKPDYAEAHYNLGVALIRQRRFAEAVDACREAVALKPEFAEAHGNLGHALRGEGDLDEAVASYRAAIALKPDYAEAHYNLGEAFSKQGSWEKAIAAYRGTIEIKPDHAEAHYNLGKAYSKRGSWENATAAYRRAIKSKPDFFLAHYSLGGMLVFDGKPEKAVSAFRDALEIEPNNLRAKWAALLTLPVIYASPDDVDRYRTRWEKGVNTLLGELDLGSDDKIKQAVKALTSRTNFHLHYQGRNDRRLQELYGTLLHRIVCVAYPDLCQPLPRRRPAPNGKIRVGFISSFMRDHSVYKTRGSIIKKLDKARFEIHSFYTGNNIDSATVEIRRHSDVFRHCATVDHKLLATIRASELDALIFLDIGMDPKMQLPAALRLAPVQCVTYGHPVTSGLRTIDYFLSSDLMEPDDSDSHYSERLIKLPNLGICYQFPEAPSIPHSQNDERIGEDEVIYLCSQNLIKLLPQFDSIFARIAAQVPRSRFWFIANRSGFVTDIFKDRLTRAFSDENLSAEKHCVIHPQMSRRDFMTLNDKADVLLDSFTWSGCNSTLEAISCGLPVVTLPGAMMRARHSYAILKMIGIDETIARDDDHYVEIAVRLGKNRQWRDSIADRVRDAAPRAFGDELPIQAIETFLERVCRSGNDGVDGAPHGI